MKKCALFVVAGAALSVSALADVEVILVPESGNDTIASLDPATGFEINLAFIDLDPVRNGAGSTAKDVI